MRIKKLMTPVVSSEHLDIDSLHIAPSDARSSLINEFGRKASCASRYLLNNKYREMALTRSCCHILYNFRPTGVTYFHSNVVDAVYQRLDAMHIRVAVIRANRCSLIPVTSLSHPYINPCTIMSERTRTVRSVY